MSNNSTTVTVDVKTNLAEAVSQSEKLKNNLQAAGAGRRTYAQAAAARGVASKGGMDAEDSNTARGIGGMTGAAGRDFSAQAKGLGGLVHVYATFAANLFAVSAAFTALNKAANITNMVKGLDQLGAAAGRNLGTLAKSVVEVSDGALSLADSMTAVAQASSGGMTSQNILRMTEVAKKASQALGRDMPDAMNRLSRGITKIEPELLDELGIMVKVNEASEMYARQLGKTVAGLSDFEKRQGYANAVLAEGERKFGAIQLDANPYQKILASITNIAIQGGSLINKVLGPILDILSKSPTALATALAGIGTVLLKQAIPALGAWRANMQQAAETARDIAIDANKLRVQKLAEKDEQIGIDMAAKEIAATNKLNAAYDNLAVNKARTAKTSRLMNIDLANATEEQILALEKQAVARGKLRILEDGASTRSKKAAIDAQAEAAQIKALTAALRERNAVAEEANKLHASVTPAQKIGGYFSNDQARNRLADKAEAKAIQSSILGNVAKNLPVAGIVDSFIALKSAISNAMKGQDELGNKFEGTQKKMTKLAATTTAARGAITILGSGISTLIMSLTSVFAVIGLIIGAVALLDMGFSKATKELDKFNSTSEATVAALENIDRTLEVINNKTAGKAFNVESIQARANAFNELSSAILAQSKAYDKVLEKMGRWDKFKNSIKGIFGSGIKNTMSENLADSIIKGLAVIDDPKTKAMFQEGLRGIFDSKDLKFYDSEKLAEQVSEGLDEKQLSNKIALVEKLRQQINLTVNNAASFTSSFASGLTETAKLVDQMNTKLKTTDEYGKIGEQLLSDSKNLTAALKTPITALASLQELIKNTQVLSLLPADTQQQLISAKAGIDDFQDSYAKTLRELEEVRKKANLSNKEVATIANEGFRSGKYNSEKTARDIIATEREAAKIRLETLEQEKIKLEKYASITASSLSATGDALFNKGISNLARALNTAFSEGSIIAARGYLNVIKSAGGDTAAAEGRLRQQELDLQLQLIDSTYDNIVSQENLRLSVEALRLVEEKKLLLGSGENKAYIAKLVAELDKKISTIDDKKRVLSLPAEAITNILQNKLVNKDPRLVTNIVPGSTTEDLKNTLKEFPAVVSSSFERAGKRARILAEKESAAALSSAAIKDERSANTQRVLKNEISILENSKKQIEQAQTAKGIYDEILQTEREKLETQLAEKQYYLTIEPILNNLAKAGLDKGVSRKAQEDLATASEKYIAEDAERNQKNTTQRLAGLEEIRSKTAEYANKNRDLNKDITMAELSGIEAVITAKQSLGQISEENLAIEQANVELIKLATSASIEQANVADAYDKRKVELNNALKLRPNDPDLLQRLAEEDALYERQKIALATKNEALAKGIQLTKESKLEQAAWNTLIEEQKASMDVILNATVSLGAAFGKVGAAVGAFAAALAKTAEKQNKLNEDIADNRKKYSAEKDAGRLAKEEQRYIDKTTETKLDAIQEVTIATKNAFKEGSAAQTAMFAIEKGIAAYKLVMAYKELAMTYAVMEAKTIATQQESAHTSFRIAERQAEATVEGGTVVLAQGKGDPYTAFARMAAMAAVVATILSSIGAKSSAISVPVGATAEEMQKTQGTGQKYGADGKLVATGGGVFGDQEAKSESIKNSLEIIKDNTIEGLGYDQKMLKALQSIDSAIGNTAKSLYNIPGLRSGSISGAADISVSTSGIKGLFGSSTTNEIIDSGLEVSGTFGQLAKSAAGLVRAYETIRTTKVSSGFLGIGGSTKVSDSKNYIGVSTQVEDEITAIFKNASDLFTVIGEQIGLTAADVTSKLNTINIGNAFTSLRGLKGEELEKEFSAVIGTILDDAANTVFASMSKYAQFGEGLLETTVRVVDGFDKVKVDLGSISMSIDKFTYDISESIIKNAGGLDEFTGQISFFIDNFLTESERLAPISENVNKVMTSLGLSAVDTREEFAYVVRSLDLTTTAGRDTYQQLMDISEAFAEVHAETRIALSAEERLSQLRNQYVRILELENKKTESIALARELELENMDEALKVGAKYIWAMEDELDLKTQLTEAYDNESAALQSTIDGLTASIDTLNKYKDSLKLGAQSVLTPSQKYAESKSQVYQTAEIANSIATTDAEKKAKADAIANLPAVAGAFLEASRGVFASSAQYTTDYNSILSLVGSTTSALEVQKSTAEQQLDTLNAQYDSLGIIKDSTSTMAELMPQFILAQDRTTAAMAAYYAAGGPGQNPATAPNGIDQSVFSATVKLQNEALIKEVQLLNKQMDALRKEQNKQTADLVLAQKAVAEAKLAADKAAAEAAAAANWNASISPWYDSSGAWISTGGD